jgi:hypothetical protein
MPIVVALLTNTLEMLVPSLIRRVPTAHAARIAN